MKTFALQTSEPPHRTGYSLLEVTVVLLLLGIVTAVAQPRFSSALSFYRVEAAAKRVRSDLEYARALARVRSQLTTVHFTLDNDDGGGNFYRFDDSAPPPYQSASEETRYRVDLTAEPYRVQLRSAPDKIAFDLYGRPTSPGVIEVAIGEQSMRILVEASGEVRIE